MSFCLLYVKKRIDNNFDYSMMKEQRASIYLIVKVAMRWSDTTFLVCGGETFQRTINKSCGLVPHLSRPGSWLLAPCHCSEISFYVPPLA